MARLRPVCVHVAGDSRTHKLRIMDHVAEKVERVSQNEGELLNHIYVVQSGSVKLIRNSEDGKELIVNLVGIPCCGPRLTAHLRDRLGVERADTRREVGIRPAECDGTRSTLLERRIVEEGVRIRVEDLVRHR